VREGTYDVVVGNPPYQGLTKTELFEYIATKYEGGKDNLYAAFLDRGLELAREGGLSALLTMRGWMFSGQFTDLRNSIQHMHDLRLVGDVDRGAFEDVPDEVLAVVMSVVRRAPPTGRPAIAIQPTSLDDRSRDGARTMRKRAALLVQVGRYEFDPKCFEVIEGEPLLYWWSEDDLSTYREFPLLGTVHTVAAGLKTGADPRFLRLWFEVDSNRVPAQSPNPQKAWQFYIKGAAGSEWIEPATQVLCWARDGFELKVFGTYCAPGTVRLRDSSLYFRLGIAFSPIGTSFSARAHRRPSIFGNMGSSVFTEDIATTLCTMNSSRARRIVQALNPGLHFENDDVKRLPLFPIPESAAIYAQIERAFSEHERHRECSIEFISPGESSWRYAQEWAQKATDRPTGAPLPPFTPKFDPPAPEAQVSFAIGIALGRFGVNREGILDTAPAGALPAGILFVGPSEAHPDSLAHPSVAPVLKAWEASSLHAGGTPSLRVYLRRSFFDWHKSLYENRPIYFPLSSVKRSYVAFISIHRWGDDTLQVLLADHLLPEKRRLEGELDDIREARAHATGRGKAEKRFAEVGNLLEELSDFIEKVTAIATFGPPPPDDKTPRREVDAPFVMDLDDGVMVNSAGLWPLLEPQWKDPKKWWRELATAQGRKDYDWAHLAARYFPARVREKCVKDPSLAVAHKCFWELHPAKAYAWELRLQDEIRPDFMIDEPGSDEARARFLRDHASEARDILAKEAQRRARKAAKADDDDDASATPLLDRVVVDETEEADA
jgi:hypothetical protein